MTEPVNPPFPLAAVVGQDELRLALLLHAVEPRLGGVLVRGEKGSGKSTAARALAGLLPPLAESGGPAPFVELPVGATEDRVVGALDLEGALVEGRRRLQPGLLHAAHRGVLYVDEVNLLPDHLVDVLIDAAASGVNHVERDGITATHECRFVLVGSMNPEEGELRPQLLDRFGLAVTVAAPTDPTTRAEVVRRRLAYDTDPDAFAARYAAAEAQMSERIVGAVARLRDVSLPDDVLALAASLCAELGAEGLRADLALARGAVALAAYEGRTSASADDVVRLAPLALAHRRRHGPLDTPGLDPGELADALDRLDQRAADSDPDSALPPDPPEGGPADADRPSGGADRPSGGAAAADAAAGVALRLDARRPSGVLGRRQRGPAGRGALIPATTPTGPVTDLAVAATATAAAVRRATEPAANRDTEATALRTATEPATSPGATGSASERPVTPGDLRQAVREARTANLVVLAVDASGSMGSPARMEAAKGAVLSLLTDAYQRRDRVALVTFAGNDAKVALRPTGSVEVARARLAELPTGGRTPLAAGLAQALDVVRRAARSEPDRRGVIAVVTDGRATAPEPDPAGAARSAAAAIASAGVEALVIDAEDGHVRLGLARRLAEVMGAAYVALPDLAAGALAGAVRELLAEA